MGGQERIEIGERLLAQVRAVEPGIDELSVLAERLPMALEQVRQLRRARRRLAEKAPDANLLDVARLEGDGDREAVLQLVQLGRVDGRPRVVLSQRLLRRADDPDLAAAEILQ